MQYVYHQYFMSLNVDECSCCSPCTHSPTSKCLLLVVEKCAVGLMSCCSFRHCQSFVMLELRCLKHLSPWWWAFLNKKISEGLDLNVHQYQMSNQMPRCYYYCGETEPVEFAHGSNGTWRGAPPSSTVYCTIYNTVSTSCVN
jgi:hypothetical protein